MWLWKAGRRLSRKSDGERQRGTGGNRKTHVAWVAWVPRVRILTEGHKGLRVWFRVLSCFWQKLVCLCSFILGSPQQFLVWTITTAKVDFFFNCVRGGIFGERLSLEGGRVQMRGRRWKGIIISRDQLTKEFGWLKQPNLCRSYFHWGAGVQGTIWVGPQQKRRSIESAPTRQKMQ